MSTSVQQVIDRAVALSVANQGLADNIPDLIYRVNLDQRARWTQFVQANRTSYQVSATKTSTASNGNRVCDLSTLILPVERVLTVRLPGGTEVREVDLQDVDAELAPRYYPSGETLIEVATDWDTATPNAVPLSIAYVFRPLDLDPTGLTSQVVSIPDGYVGILVYSLGAYFAESDVGRPDTEFTRLMGQSDAMATVWIAQGGHYAGVSAYRFAYPTPTPADKA